MRDRGAYGCSVLWSTPTVIQRPVVDGERKGVNEVR